MHQPIEIPRGASSKPPRGWLNVRALMAHGATRSSAACRKGLSADQSWSKRLAWPFTPAWCTGASVIL